MEEEVNNIYHRFEESKLNMDTKRMMKLITAAAEAAFIKAFKLESTQAKAMSGRGTVTIETVTKSPDDEYDIFSTTEKSKAYEDIAALYLKHSRRLEHFATRQRYACTRREDTELVTKYRKLNQEARQAMLNTKPEQYEEACQ